MRRVLGIDTAGSILAVGTWSDDGPAVEASGRRPLEHSRRLVAVIAEVLAEAGWEPGDLDLIAVTRGPGSYTGLRLGAMAAKILAWSGGVPLVGVDALAVRAANAAGLAEAVVAALPARRGWVYAGAYRLDGDARPPRPLAPVEEGAPEAVLDQLLKVAGPRPLLLGEGIRGIPFTRGLEAGDGFAAPAPEALDIPRGSVVARLGRWAAAQEGTVDAVTFVPWYAGSDQANPGRGGRGVGAAP